MKRKITWLVITGLTAAGTLAAISNRQDLMAQIGIEPSGATTTPQAGLPADPGLQQEAIHAMQARQQAQRAFEANQQAQFRAAGVAVMPPGNLPALPALGHTYGPSGQFGTSTTYNFSYATPASHQDEQRIQSLLAEYQSTSDQTKRKEAVDQITKTVNHQFEERQLVRERELKQLEERLAELKEKHAKRESLKEKIVNDRVEQLINNIDGLGWGNEPGPWLGQPIQPVGSAIAPTALVPQVQRYRSTWSGILPSADLQPAIAPVAPLANPLLAAPDTVPATTLPLPASGVDGEEGGGN